MTKSELTTINSITGEMYSDIADIGEEIIDRNPPAALKIIDELIGKLKHLKANLRRDEI